MKLPELIFDGLAVYKGLTRTAEQRTSYENVSDVLDSVARLARDDIREICQLREKYDALEGEFAAFASAVRRYLKAERELRHISHRPEWLARYPTPVAMADSPEVQEKVDALNALRILSANQETPENAANF